MFNCTDERHVSTNGHYQVCGLRVRSDRSIPDLVPAQFDHPDLEICFHEHPDSRRFGKSILRYSSQELTPSGTPTVRLSEIVSPSTLYILLYGDGTEFVIDAAGTRVWATWPGASTFEDTLTYLLGPVLGFVLRLGGVTCLHASAIAVDDVAIALAGPGGCGKSTMAAQFASWGCPVLSDDIVTLEECGTSFLVQPSPARLRLWPSSVEGLFGRADALPRLTPSWEKQYFDLRGGNCRFQSGPLPLSAIYLLNNADQPTGEIVEISSSAAMVQLLGNIYVNYLLDDRFRRRDFERMAQVLRMVPVRQLNLQHDFSVLQETCRSVLRDVEELRRNRHPLPPALGVSGLAPCVR